MKPMHYKLFIVTAVVIGLLLSGFAVFNSVLQKKSAYEGFNNHVKLGSATFKVKVVESDTDRAKGLSGTDSLALGEAMLFVFPKSHKWGIWMKEMNYPIDIIWLNQQKEVVDIERDAKPESYPKSFEPSVNAAYVLETVSGASDRYGIKIGSKADFKLDGEL